MQTITIAGRVFKGAKDSTMEHDVFVQGMIERSGLSRIEMLRGETPDAFALRIFRIAVVNSDIFLLLGGLLFPGDLDPAKWTPEIAEATAGFLKKLTDAEDKRIVQGQITAAIMGFFQQGLAYGVISPSYSEASKPEPKNLIEVPTISESGAQ